MNCPVCNTALVQAKHSGIEVASCPKCQGMWFTNQQLDRLENETFDWGDEKKGTLVFSSTDTDRKCPQCSKPMKRFHYRLYDLELEFCDLGHGFWLDAGEDKRVRELMKKEEDGVFRSAVDEDKWVSYVKHLHSNSFMDKVRNLFQ